MRRPSARPLLAPCLALALAACGRGDRAPRAVTSAASSGGPATLVKDLRLGAAPLGSLPGGWVASGGLAYFTADDGSSGRELWRSDGTAAGTRLVKDILPGGGSSAPGHLAALGGLVLFAANDGARGTELWKTDGTEAGTALVKDLQPGSRGSTPRDLTAVGARVFFVAETAANGAELWVTDGTEDGTTLVRDIATSPTAEVGSDPSGLVAVGGTLFFAATDARGTELWKSDGTAAGTVLVADIDPAGSSDPTGLTAWNGKVWFAARTPAAGGAVQLWASDGSSTAVVGAPASNPTDPSLLTPFGTSLHYRAMKDGEWNLWATNGTVQTKLTTGLDPVELAVSGSRLLLSATRAAEGQELFSWNGAALALLADIVPGVASSSPAALTDAGGTLFFRANAAGIPVLWVSDGTMGGTRAVFATGGPEVGEIVALGALALFSGADGATGAEPWRSDGSEGGSARLANLRPDVGGADPRDLAVWSGDGAVYFSADDGVVGRELFRSDGTEAGTGLAWDVYFGPGADANVGELVDSGPLLFAAFDALSGREPWRWDGVQPEPATLLADLRPGPAGSGPAEPTRLGAATFFSADDGANGRELWRTDGTSAGTALVTDLAPGALSSGPSRLTPAAGLLYFAATENGVDLLPFRSDGTAGGTFSVGAVPSFFDPVLDPTGFLDLGGQVLFAATAGPFDDRGRELFRATASETTLVTDLAPGAASSNPVPLVVHAGEVWFAANAGSGAGLYRTDGTEPGTVLVKLVGTKGGGEIGSAVGLGGLLYFVANDEASGPELWTSDGTAAGTHAVRDAYPGPTGAAAGSVLVPLPSRGHVLYAAADDAAGRELWISNGTPLGTRLLHDLWPGSGSSNPAAFVVKGDLVYFTADDGASGRELWVLDVSPAALDLTPPVPLCTALTREATDPGGATPAFSITATDDVSAPATITFSYAPAPGSAFPLGTTSVLATAVDESGNVAQCSFDLTVVDTTPPVMSCPATAISEATSAAGADATYPPALATDLVSSSIVSYSKASGTLFPLGDTVVTATGVDASGNAASCELTVRVQDTTAPAVTCPAGPTVPATGPSGATASYPPATATDLVTAEPAILLAYSTPSGATFPLGTTVVTVTATDAAGNAGACTFPVVVEDTTPPTIACPLGPSVEATSVAGAVATWADASVSDLETAAPVVEFVPDRGSTFPLGVTTVTATATDLGGNTSSCTFAVTVVDTIPPTVSCPADEIAEATGPSGAAVPFPDAIAADAATATPAVSYEADLGGGAVGAPPGTTFPLGATAVTATATDGSGNAATCAFTVTVLDTTAPGIACPGPVSAEAGDASGVAVTFPSATATDAVTAAPSVAAAPASGSVFPPGVTTVTFTALDEAGNGASCTMEVTVTVREPDAGGGGGCGCGSGSGGSLALGGLLVALLRRRAGPASAGAPR